MVALSELKSGDRMTVPWYGGGQFSFRVDDDMTWNITGGGTQRRISITPLEFSVGTGILTFTAPKRGASYLTVAKQLLLHPPKQGAEKLADTFTFEELGACHRATDDVRLCLGNYTIVQRSYLIPNNNGILLAEQHTFNKSGDASMYFYKAISVNEGDLRRLRKP